MNEVELPVHNIISYFVGYIKHRLYRIIESESRYKRNAHCYMESYDGYYVSDEVNLRKTEFLVSEENISSWYSGSEIIDEYLKNQDSKILTNHEKEIINMKLEGNTFGEISTWIGLSYKQVLYIYNKGIEKLKFFLFGGEKSLQNAAIF